MSDKKDPNEDLFRHIEELTGGKIIHNNTNGHHMDNLKHIPEEGEEDDQEWYRHMLKLWADHCVRKNAVPICLITASEDGDPYILTVLSPEELEHMLKVLAQGGPISRTTHFPNQEN